MNSLTFIQIFNFGNSSFFIRKMQLLKNHFNLRSRERNYIFRASCVTFKVVITVVSFKSAFKSFRLSSRDVDMHLTTGKTSGSNETFLLEFIEIHLLPSRFVKKSNPNRNHSHSFNKFFVQFKIPRTSSFFQEKVKLIKYNK